MNAKGTGKSTHFETKRPAPILKQRELRPLQRYLIPCDQCLFLSAFPPFDLALAAKADGSGFVRLNIREFDGPSFRRVRRGTTFVVLAKPKLHVASFSDVVRTVSASQDVNKPHATTMPSSDD